MSDVFLILVFGAITTALLNVLYARSHRLRGMFEEAPRQAIANFDDRAEGKILGKLAYRSEPLVAPLTGRRCAYYEVIVEECQDDARWHVVISEAEGQEFLLEDGTGRAIVDPTLRETLIDMDVHTKSGMFNKPTPRESDFLARHGMKDTGWPFNKTFRYKEGVLEEGELVAVLGRGTKEPDPDGVAQAAGYRSGPPMRLRMRGTAQEPLRISDDPKVLS